VSIRGKIVRALLIGSVVVGLVAGIAFLAMPETQAKRPGGGGPGGCVCPMIYAPVTCDNGQTYSNQCVADCHNATGCEPAGPGPYPV